MERAVHKFQTEVKINSSTKDKMEPIERGALKNQETALEALKTNVNQQKERITESLNQTIVLIALQIQAIMLQVQVTTNIKETSKHILDCHKKDFYNY